MKVQIYENKKVFLPEGSIFGVKNENKAEKLEIEYPEKYAEYTKAIELRDGKWLVTDDIENDDGQYGNGP